ncbi:MAG TPA: hypothetical protein VMK32_11740 [Burkholderiaceae bacterium]|nr:hypothetical protein [Burkholderiaceae bacterium]
MPRSTKPAAYSEATAAEYRERLAAIIAAALQRHPRVRAIGEGGAAARGRADAYSDLDLFIVAPLEDAKDVFAKVEAAIATVTTITHTWSVDPPGFPDLAQRFYVVKDAPRFFAVDCCVVSESGLSPFLERERHGTFVAWSDPAKLFTPRRADRTALAQRRRQRLAQLRGAIPVHSMLVEKELARGHTLEAMGFYQALLRFLIELLGMRHRPERFDFGWRYVDRELPDAARALITRHGFVSDGAALRRQLRSLVSELDAQLAAIDAPASTSARA